MITRLAKKLDEIGPVVKNLDKHSCKIETLCEQIVKMQSLILDKFNYDNFITYNSISTRSGKKM